jgi:hypothetical protein
LTLISWRLYRRHSVNNDKSNVANNRKKIGMNIGSKLTLAAITALFLSAAGLASAQSDAPYTEGPVWAITMVRTKAGMTDDYLKNLAKNYRASMDEEKKQDIIMDYKILLGDASTAQDYDILLMVEYKNMAMLDGLREKMDPIGRKIIGGEEQQRQGAVKRAEIREILGDKTMREITLKAAATPPTKG